MKRLIIFILLLLPVFSYGQIVTTIAGGVSGHGGYWGDGGPATAAEFSSTGFIVSDKLGNIYVADPGNYRIRKIDAVTNIVTTVAGDGVLGYSPDGTIATAAHFKYPAGVCIDEAGNIYITDCNDYRIRKVDAITGIISTVAGNGIQGYTGDGGPATNAQIYAIGYTCVDNMGNLYFGDYHKVRKVDVFGIVSTIAGTGFGGVTGDGVAATATNICEAGISVDVAGNLYVADTTGSVRKISRSTGKITRVAGTGDNIISPYSGDGSIATSCHMGPLGITVDPIGNIYIADHANSKVERVNTVGIVNTVAGSGVAGFSGDGGPATAAAFYYVEHVAVDNCGNVYIADFGNKRIRKVTFSPSCDPTKLSAPTVGYEDIISVYPNPAGDVLHINTVNGKYQTLTITNSIGQVMLQQNITAAETAVPVSKLPAGVYYISLRGSGGAVVSRFIKD